MVETTAGELTQDLGAVTNGSGPPAVNGAGGQPNLLPRLQALEEGVARQDRIFRRLMDLLGAYAEPQR
jgi:hypothetical protein